MQGASSGQLGIFELLGGSNLEGSIVRGESLANGIEMDRNSSYFASSWISPCSRSPCRPASPPSLSCFFFSPPSFPLPFSSPFAKVKHDKQGVAAGEDHKAEKKVETHLGPIWNSPQGGT